MLHLAEVLNILLAQALSFDLRVHLKKARITFGGDFIE